MLAARRAVLVTVAGLVVLADQASKTWALRHTVPPRHVVGSLWLTLTLNRGAAFGLGQGVTPVVEAVVVALVAGLVVFGRRASRHASRPAVIGLGLLVGGAIGNLGDRLLRHHHGAVIDFIDIARVGSRDWWPVFNLADAAIVVGAVTLAAANARRPHDRATTTP